MAALRLLLVLAGWGTLVVPVPRTVPPPWQLRGADAGHPPTAPAPQVDPYFMDSDSESDGEGTPRTQQGAALPAIEAAQVAGNLSRKRGRDECGAGAGGQQRRQQLGECGAHPGPCTNECADLELDELLRRQKEMAATQAAAQAAVAPSQRQPKRRRKKLHDLSGVGSVGITARGPLDKYRFNMFMRDLLGEKARDIFRCKGMLCIKVSVGLGRDCGLGMARRAWAGWQPVLPCSFWRQVSLP